MLHAKTATGTTRRYMSGWLLCLTWLLLSTTLWGQAQILDSMPEKPERLTIIGLDIDVEQLRGGVELFEETYGIEVEWQALPYGELWPQITTSIVGGATFDLYMMSNSWHAELGTLGMALPLSAIVDEATLAELTANYFPRSIDFLSSGGELWGLPNTVTMPIFYYNTAILAELGYDQAPTTWAELEQIAREAIDAGLAEHAFHPGWTTGEDMMVWFDMMLKLHGGQWMDEAQSTWTFDSDAGVAALSYMKYLLDEGLVPQGALELGDWDNMHGFLSGRNVFEINWMFVYGMAENPDQSSIIGNFSTSLVPSMPGGESYTVLGGGGYAISPTTRSPEWSLELLAHLTGEAAARGVLEDQFGAEAAWQALYQAPLVDEFSDLPLLNLYMQQIDTAGVRPSDYLTWYSDLRNNIMIPNLGAALRGEMSIEEALNAAQIEAQQTLEQEGL